MLIIFMFIFTLYAAVIFIFSLNGLRKSKETIYKVLASLTWAYLLFAAVFLINTALTPKVIPNSDSSFTFEGHQYAVENFGEFPDRKDLKKVAFVIYPSDSKLEEFISSLLFPSRLYIVKNDTEKDVLWEVGLMLEVKYKKME
ncbi:hypothetical protein OXPF_14990 [Oxobacter pfennigii]|uniref:Uncharacterized protein n=1 Tax=Oxobacter pfennigii TaxID=36849 RepID=A0A0P8W8M3_9CLOT|nr:hypothetical protein [Oxobacter pfennigii]KPU45021.1 hypothetical protein OXPF_14990 [Oxobacter pfennigii]